MDTTRKIAISYTLTEAGQRLSLLAGGTGARSQEVTADLTPAWIALAQIARDGTATCHVQGTALQGAWPAPATVEELLAQAEAAAAEAARVEAEREVKAAAAEAAYERSVRKWAALPLADRVARKYESSGEWIVSGPSRYDSRRHGPRYGAEDFAPEAYVKTIAEVDRLNEIDRLVADKAQAKREAQDAAAKAEREAKDAAAKIDRANWVAEHGSEKLVATLDVGLLDRAHQDYLLERLAVEHPGWVLGGNSNRDRPRMSPTLRQVEALVEARVWDPEADLRFYKGQTYVEATWPVTDGWVTLDVSDPADEDDGEDE